MQTGDSLRMTSYRHSAFGFREYSLIIGPMSFQPKNLDHAEESKTRTNYEENLHTLFGGAWK